jgi:hypothetical protein
MQLIHPRYGADVLGLPSRAMVLTNSERTTAACAHRWLLAEGDGLRPTTRAAPLEFGTAGHAAVEDVHLWWSRYDTTYPDDGSRCVWCRPAYHPDDPVFLQASDCQLCGGTGLGPVARSARDWHTHAVADTSGDYDGAAADQDALRLARMVQGWLHVYGADPDPQLRVVAPELRLAAPVLGPTGAPYAPRTWQVPDGDGWRLARTGEAHLPGARVVRWPWFQLLTLDALLQDRDTGDLWVYEAKTASNPARRMQSVSIDPQVAGYVWAAQHAVRAGMVPGVSPDAVVRGYVFDVLCSRMQKDPDELAPVKVQATDDQGRPLYHQTKANGGGLGPTETRRKAWLMDDQGEPVMRSPGLSRSRAAGVPSWRYRAALDRLGLDPADYQDHLLELMQSTDAHLYVRDTATSGPEVGARYARELYAVAQQLATYRRRAAELTDPLQRDVQFPRQPVPCMQGYGCAYRGPCLQDGALVRRDYTLADPVRWADNDNDTAAQPQEDLGW